MDDRAWGELSRTLRTSAPFAALSVALGGAAPGDRTGPVGVDRLPLPAAAWVGELLGDSLGRPLLVVVPREADALAWLEAAELFAAADRRESGAALYFPAPSLTPYQEADPSLLVRAQEAVVLDAVVRRRARTVVTTPRALFRLLPAADAIAGAAVELTPGDDLAIDALTGRLATYGYRRADLVTEVGDFAVRGGVFDLYPPGEELPLRLDFFGDTVESIRRFEPASQRSEETVEGLRILPLTLFPAGPEEAARLAALLIESQGADAISGGAAAGWTGELGAEAAKSIDRLRQDGGFAGWESYLPLLADDLTDLAALLGDPLVVSVDREALAEEVEHHRGVLDDEHRARRRAGKLALPPALLEQDAAAVDELLAGARVEIAGPGAREVDFGGSLTDLFHGQLPRFPAELATARARGERAIMVVEPGHRERMAELLAGRGIEVAGMARPSLSAGDPDSGADTGADGDSGASGDPGAGAGPLLELVEGELGRGFRLPAAAVAVYGEQQVIPRRAAPARRTRKVRYGPFVSSLRDLKVGDYVVHSDHGIAQFVGLRTVGGEDEARKRLPPELKVLVPEESPVEVMELVYSSGKRLLVPLDRLDLIQKYSGIEGVAPRLDKLGGTSWNKTKSRIKQSMRDMAAELLKLYAARQVAEAPAMAPASDNERQFAAAFAYEETPDQLDAIAAIQEDLEKSTPMDRLLCGDVGYGKTEVAMRAAFKVFDNGYQVAVLAPTTILADQHLETFRRRFDGFETEIDMISRFRSPAEVKEIRRRGAAGGLDVLIGTHRLLSKDVELPNLGLLIVDEEQRFGVAQKERLKQLRKNVHVLAMSATPVPRTLQLSLAGVRDMSVIETPPRDRMAVETAIVPFSGELIRDAVEHEMERGGQVYFVYNRVETIEKMLSYLREVVPEVRITVGHGQLEEGELARRMHAFTAGEYDVLLATTIIENGIDIPNVNTMIVHRADRFGLAQLYQLRGRVGRSNQLAYCYLMVPGDRILSQTARKRLDAIREFTDLGAGFRIAARDLEIRGAGNLLGAEQSGHIAAVGLETYLKMLDDAVRELKGEVVEEGPSAAIDLPLPLSIPQDYIADANLRMEIYRRIAAGEEAEAELTEELSDRFGPPPPAVGTLIQVGELKRLAEGLRVQSITARRGEVVIRMRRDARVDVERLIALVSATEGAAFSPSGVLTLPASGAAEMLRVSRATLAELAAPAPEAPAVAGAAPS